MLGNDDRTVQHRQRLSKCSWCLPQLSPLLVSWDQVNATRRVWLA